MFNVVHSCNVPTLFKKRAMVPTEVQNYCNLMSNSFKLAHFFADQYVRGEDVNLLASMIKLKAGRLAREVTDSCLQFWGGMGYSSSID